MQFLFEKTIEDQTKTIVETSKDPDSGNERSETTINHTVKKTIKFSISDLFIKIANGLVAIMLKLMNGSFYIQPHSSCKSEFFYI